MKNVVRAFGAHPRPKQRLLLSTTVLLLATEGLLSVRVVPIRRVRGVVRLLTRVLYPRSPRSIAPEDVVWALDAVTPLLPESVTCLRRAVVAQSLFERQGHPTRMRIGVLKHGDGLRAHAWVEHDGGVLVGELDDLVQYALLPTDEAGL